LVGVTGPKAWNNVQNVKKICPQITQMKNRRSLSDAQNVKKETTKKEKVHRLRRFAQINYEES